MPKALWDDDFYVRIYDMASKGRTDSQMASALEVSLESFKRWVRDKPALKKALLKARGKSGSYASREVSFKQYVYGRLPDSLRALWDRINVLDQEANGLRVMEEMLKGAGKGARQHLFLYALVESSFNASEACRKVNITRRLMEEWMRKDPDFMDLVQEIQWHKKNFVEGSLMGLISQGDSPATIFAAKTLLKDRGFGDKTEVEVNGRVDHIHAHVPIDQLGLSLEVRRQLLEALRRQDPTIIEVPRPAREKGSSENGQEELRRPDGGGDGRGEAVPGHDGQTLQGSDVETEGL